MKRNPLFRTAIRIAAGFCLAAAGLTALAAEPPKGLVLYYSFDQAGTDGAVADRSGRNNSGRAVGGKWVSYGKQGGGFEFAAGGNHIHVANSESLKMKRATLAVWFRTSMSDPIWRRIIDKNVDQGFGLVIGGDAKGLSSRGRLAFAINGKLCLSDNVVTDGAWHHGAATFDGENLKIYVDGLPQKQMVPFREEIPSNANDLTIGLNRSNLTPREKDQSFEGVVDEVMIFNRALSADEIKAMVVAVDPSAGKPKFTKQQVKGRLRQLKLLYEEGLLTDEFYEAKVRECEAAQ